MYEGKACRDATANGDRMVLNPAASAPHEVQQRPDGRLAAESQRIDEVCRAVEGVEVEVWASAGEAHGILGEEALHDEAVVTGSQRK
jgi:hypothetical protein